MIKRFVIAAVIVALFLGGVGYFQFVMKPKFIGEFMAKMVPPPATVTTEKAKTATWADQVHSIGTMLAIQGVDVAPEVGGVVTNYFFDSGQDVEKGAKLVELDTSVEQAELKVDQAILEVANLEYDRQSKLVGKGAISQSTLDTTISKRDAAAAAVQKNLAHIAHKNITAPFAGRLGLRRVERGQYVSIGQTLVWLQALDPIWIDFPVSESEMGRLKPKAAIELTVAAFPGEVFKGEIEAFDARVNQDTRQLMVRGRLPNPERKLLPGMFANVAVVAGEPKTSGLGAAHGGHLRTLRRQHLGGERSGSARTRGAFGLGRGGGGKRHSGNEADRRAPFRAARTIARRNRRHRRGHQRGR